MQETNKIKLDWNKFKKILDHAFCSEPLTAKQLSEVKKLKFLTKKQISILEHQAGEKRGELQNSLVRKFLGKKLKTAQKNKPREDIAKWIIVNWGGIQNHNRDNLEKLVKCFGKFSMPEIGCFLDKMTKRKNPFDRIASWSKLLSFAYPDKYAIYDARVAATMNWLLLKDHNENIRFYDPPTQVTWLKKLQSRSHKILGYCDYLRLLKQARKKFGKDMLQIEKALWHYAIHIQN